MDIRGDARIVDTHEIDLVSAARLGQEEAFSALVQLHWVRLVRFARSVAGESDAEDCVQEALVIAWEKLPTLRENGLFAAWTLRIVSRLCIRRARRQSRMVALDIAGESADPRSSGWTEAVNVERVLASLPPRQRAVMHLTVIEGMADSEIGEALAITAASVRSHRRRARETLRQVLQSRKSDCEVNDDSAGRKEA